MKLISIVIPVFNKEEYLINSINSVLNQTYSNWELILINDGSSDNSEQIILDFQKKDSRIIYIMQENQGVSNARNVGIKKAIGDYVCFLDADDYYDNSFLDRMVSEVNNAYICYCGHYYVTPNGDKRKAKIKFIADDIITDYFYNKCTPHTNSFFLDRNFLLKNELRFCEDLNWGEDMLFFSKALTLANEVKYVGDYLTNYSVDIINSLSSPTIDKMDKDVLWLKEYLSFLENEEGITVKKKEGIRAAIEGYRLPALLIYRLKSYVSVLSKEELQIIYDRFKTDISKIKYNNGLRSLKLYFYYMLLKFNVH